jgi:CBS domain-containing protein
MLVKTLLKRKPRQVITADPAMSFSDAMELLITNGISCLPIIDQGRLVGIVSDKDIFKRIHETDGRYHDLTIGDVMTTDLIVGLPTDELSYIAGMMDKAKIRHVLVVEGGDLVGLVSQRDIIKTQAKNREIENRYLTLYMEGLGGRDMSGHI